MRKTINSALALLLVLASLSGCISDEGENKPPRAFAGDDVAAEVGEDVVFTGTGLDSDGSVVRYRWDFDGDGAWDYTGDVGARIHMYTAPGSYLARLLVVDDEGAKADDTRWVNVTTSVRLNVDWANGTGFRLLVSERLDVTDLALDWTLEGLGPSPISRTFTLDAGLERVANGTFAADPAISGIEAGQRHILQVRLGEVIIGRRTIDVVDRSEPSSGHTARYTSNLYDLRIAGANWTELWRNGSLAWEAGSGWSRGHFEGNGTYYTFSNRTGLLTWENLTLDRMTVETGLGGDWGETWYLHEGQGTVEQRDTTGFYIFAWVWDYVQEVQNGTMTKDDWRRVGRYSGANDTNGTFEWIRKAVGNMVRQNGEGVLHEVLKMESYKDFEGTNQGLNFTLRNDTIDYDASRVFFENKTVYRESVQSVGYQGTSGNWTWRNTTFEDYLDANGDGAFNPDAIPYDPELAGDFWGPRPRVLEVGDTFRGEDFYGLDLTYTAKRVDHGPLVTPQGELNVTGVMAEAIHNSTWGSVLHWFWVVENGPLPGLVYEERVRVVKTGDRAGTWDLYRNVEAIESLS